MAGPALAEQVPVPSGQMVEFVDLIKDAEGTVATVWRYRFVAPQIAREGGSVGVDAALADIDAICAAFVLPRLAAAGNAPEQVVISLSDRPVAFGAPVPEATQYFEAYTIAADECVWEGF